MSTYKTFADCKLANPDDSVFTSTLVEGSFCQYKDHIHTVECNPADYLMSMGEFLGKEFKLAQGDFYIDVDGCVYCVKDLNDVDDINNEASSDRFRYILKAKALESCASHGIASIQSASGHIESINDFPIEQVLRGLETEVKSVAGHPSSSAKLYKACLDMLSAIDGERLTQRAYGFYCEFHGEQSIDFDEWVQDEDQRAPWEFMVKRGGL